jgi:hypothetical protein
LIQEVGEGSGVMNAFVNVFYFLPAILANFICDHCQFMWITYKIEIDEVTKIEKIQIVLKEFS